MSSFPAELPQLLEEIKERDLPVIVEGQKDRAALQRLGLSRIILLNKKPLYKVIEDLDADGLTAREIVILTDLDGEGRSLFRKLARECNQQGIKVNNKLRLSLFQTPLAHIEGLATYLQNQGK